MTLPSLYRRLSTFVSMRMPGTIRWAGLALLGVLIAAGVSIAASSLASQQIGLASEPVSAGDALAPQGQQRPQQRPAQNREQQHVASPTQTPAASTPQEPTAPLPTTPTPAGSGSSGGEQDHGSEGGEPADD
jgi:hypothetical protein